MRSVLLSACALLFAVSTASAEPKTVERFGEGTWQALQKELPRPTAVVFTATYCANCPALIERLSETLRERGLQAQVVAVVIDEASSEQLLSSAHYTSASRLFAFDGNEAELRYGISPRWRGETPYVALLGVEGKVAFTAGTPSETMLGTWLPPGQ